MNITQSTETAAEHRLYLKNDIAVIVYLLIYISNNYLYACYIMTDNVMCTIKKIVLKKSKTMLVLIYAVLLKRLELNCYDAQRSHELWRWQAKLSKG